MRNEEEKARREGERIDDQVNRAGIWIRQMLRPTPDSTELKRCWEKNGYLQEIHANCRGDLNRILAYHFPRESRVERTGGNQGDHFRSGESGPGRNDRIGGSDPEPWYVPRGVWPPEGVVHLPAAELGEGDGEGSVEEIGFYELCAGG